MKFQQVIVRAALAGLVTGSTAFASVASPEDSITPMGDKDKNGCGGPNGCGGKKKGDGDKDKNGCSGPNGCNGKKGK